MRPSFLAITLAMLLPFIAYAGHPLNRIAFETTLAVGDKIELYITTHTGEVAIEGAKGTWRNGEFCQYELTSSSLTIKGDVLHFGARGAALVSIDVSRMPQLEYLDVSENALEVLDLSSNGQLRTLFAFKNQLTSLQVRGLEKLFDLSIDDNKLQILDVSDCNALQKIGCCRNQLSGDAMSQFLSSLPLRSQGEWSNLLLQDIHDREEQNFASDEQVKIATEKGWDVFDCNGLLFPGFTRTATGT